MKISTKSLKAVEAILEVATLGTRKPVTLAEIRRRRGISISYLEQIFRKLREDGMVRSTHGPGGGYRLNRDPASISIADIVNVVDTNVLGGAAGTPARGAQTTDAMWSTQMLWSGLNGQLQDYLRSVTLSSLIQPEAGHKGETADPPAAAPSPYAGLVPHEAVVASGAVVPEGVRRHH